MGGVSVPCVGVLLEGGAYLRLGDGGSLEPLRPEVDGSDPCAEGWDVARVIVRCRTPVYGCATPRCRNELAGETLRLIEELLLSSRGSPPYGCRCC